MRIRRLNLRVILAIAYGIKHYDRISGPAWIDSQQYEILARVLVGATKEQALSMLQNLLAERFHLALHREARTFDGYELTVGRGGPRFIPPEFESEPPRRGSAPHVDKRGFPIMKAGAASAAAAIRAEDGSFKTSFAGETMESFCGWLASQLGYSAPNDGFFVTIQPEVVDKTGLTGAYDFTLAREDSGLVLMRTQGADTAAIGELINAVGKQLSLKLTSTKVQGEVLIIDHADRMPAGN